MMSNNKTDLRYMETDLVAIGSTRKRTFSTKRAI